VSAVDMPCTADQRVTEIESGPAGPDLARRG